MPSRVLSSSNEVGFIGLGNMGTQMAVSLAKAGFKVHLFDKCRERIQSTIKGNEVTGLLVERGSLKELMTVDAPSTIITMLPSGQQVAEAYGSNSQADGLIALASEKVLFIDCTTGDPTVAKAVSTRLSSRNCLYVDAPVSGGVAAAQQGTLTFMVGGDEDAYNRSLPILRAMGRRTFHCGPVGAGLAAKICNNMLLAISMIGTSEAMALGKSLGLQPTVLTEIINCSSGRCWSSEVYNPVPGIAATAPASHGYEGGFSVELMTKDLGLAQTASTLSRATIPMGSLAHQLYRTLCRHGYSEKDFSVVYQFLSKSD